MADQQNSEVVYDISAAELDSATEAWNKSNLDSNLLILKEVQHPV
jgi:hypothetical protein